MKIVKACSATYPTTATGALVGMDVNGTLQVTNSFPFPTADVTASDSHPNDHMAASNIAAAAPRSKANATYQNDMIKSLKEVNVDANGVGWYTSANMGNFINLGLIENQFHYQQVANEKTVALVHDVSRSSQGALSLRAFRLSPTFMAAFKENKFTTEMFVLPAPCTRHELTFTKYAKVEADIQGHSHRTTYHHSQLSPSDFLPPSTSLRTSGRRTQIPYKLVRSHQECTSNSSVSQLRFPRSFN